MAVVEAGRAASLGRAASRERFGGCERPPLDAAAAARASAARPPAKAGAAHPSAHAAAAARGGRARAHPSRPTPAAPPPPLARPPFSPTRHPSPACGATYALVPFVSNRSPGLVSGFVSAGGTAGAALWNGFVFRSQAPVGYRNMGIIIMVVSMLCFLLEWPAWGGMVRGPRKNATETDYYRYAREGGGARAGRQKRGAAQPPRSTPSSLPRPQQRVHARRTTVRPARTVDAFRARDVGPRRVAARVVAFRLAQPVQGQPGGPERAQGGRLGARR